MLKTLPNRVTLIGRIRKDTKLYALPDKQTTLGRNLVYGKRLPTPEQIRQSEQYPWQKVNAWAAGKEHEAVKKRRTPIFPLCFMREISQTQDSH